MPAEDEVTIRSAIQADSATIKHIVRSAGINPLGLVWQRFLVAECDGQVVATGQLKPHKDGTTEVASIATLPAYQHKGIASKIVRALMERQNGTLYLECASYNESFYQRFGFRTLSVSEMPPDLGKQYRLVIRFRPLIKLLMRQDVHLRIMKLDR